ncbi:MAG: hypothetical protein ACYC9L_00685 [Sulfuricaulis sp.]
MEYRPEADDVAQMFGKRVPGFSRSYINSRCHERLARVLSRQCTGFPENTLWWQLVLHEAPAASLLIQHRVCSSGKIDAPSDLKSCALLNERRPVTTAGAVMNRLGDAKIIVFSGSREKPDFV